MKTTSLSRLKQLLKPGHVYRREDLVRWSKSVDRHLKALTEDGTLKKLQNGLYHYPKQFEFGEGPPDERKLVRAFLRSDRFVLTSPNAYNMLGVGTTQLYNLRVVYNQKRHGEFTLGGRKFLFQRRLNVPKTVTQEFLLVDLVNEINTLAEDRDAVLEKTKIRAKEMDQRRLEKAVTLYGKYSTQKWFTEVLENG